MTWVGADVMLEKTYWDHSSIIYSFSFGLLPITWPPDLSVDLRTIFYFDVVFQPIIIFIQHIGTLWFGSVVAEIRNFKLSNI